MNKKGRLFVVSGPSGVGKDTVLAEMLPRFNGKVIQSVSNTTRPPRENEVQDVDYHFISTDEFRDLINTGRMLEYTEYCNTFYGTPLDPILSNIENGISMILKIEREGMLNVKKKMPEVVTVFIAPPSEEILEKRIIGRNTDMPEAVKKRLERAKYEISMSGDYDHIVVNDDLDDAVEKLEKIIKSYID